MSKRAWMSLLIAFAATTVPQAAQSKSTGKVLVVVSSKNTLTLKAGAKHPTGYYMNELGVPLKALIDAGYTPVFANPDGNEPTMDATSDRPGLFANKEEYETVKSLLASSKELKHPETLSHVAAGDLNQYSAVFVPGGHAPMEDLWKDHSLGKILKHFHKKKQPTALICHGPIALLSTLTNADDLAEALEKMGQKGPMPKVHWIYAGYKMTVFSDAEEKPNEPGKLGGYMKFYPQDALTAAGGVLSVTAPFTNNVVHDRELITGQNPMSDKELASTLLKALAGEK